MKPRVFILGLDGADDSTVGAAIREGRMPALARLINGRTQALRSTPLPITPAAWTAAYTGLNPGKTGVLTFQRRVAGTYRGRIVGSADVGDRGFHTALADAGKQVISIGFPMMSPPPNSRARIISGWDSRPDTPIANDDALAALAARHGLRIEDEFTPDAATLAKGITARFGLLDELLRSSDWDCAMLYLGFIDSLGHRLGAGNARTKELLATTDSALAALAATFPENVSFIVCSDHGFGSFARSFSVMQWLEERGYLTLRSRSFRSADSVPGIDLMDLETGVVDWSKTRAFCWEAVGRHAAISLNTRGDYPSGIVEPRDAYSLAKTIIEDLLATRDPANGEPLVVDARRREELFWGPCVSEFPEIFLETADNVTAFVGKRTRLDGGFDLEDGIVHNGPFSSHYADGIWGSSFAVPEARLGVEDLAATVYALLGVAAPPDIDGVNRSPAYAEVAATNGAYSSEEEAIVRKRLEDLGYL
jgi:uncharacterized sulfatase